MKTNKDTIDELFESLQGQFDLYEPKVGHERRFAQKLNQRKGAANAGRSWWKPLSIAASILLIIGFSYGVGATAKQPQDLSSVSPEMAQTQDFFTTTINSEINRLNDLRSPGTAVLIDDALGQLERLETEYQKLKVDLSASGNDKRVISAMIQNFQNRIDLLEEVLGMVEEIEKLKFQEDEIIL